jgi:hypothetical protein
MPLLQRWRESQTNGEGGRTKLLSELVSQALGSASSVTEEQFAAASLASGAPRITSLFHLKGLLEELEDSGRAGPGVRVFESLVAESRGGQRASVGAV